MTVRLLLPLLVLLAMAPAQAGETAPETPLAAESAEPPADPALPDDATTPSAVVQDSLPDSAPPSPPPAPLPVSNPVEGTKLLFLRLQLRTKRIEQELLTMTPEGLMEHLGVASQLLRQLRERPLADDEDLRAQRTEEYLQQLVERYVMLHNGDRAAAK